MVILEAVVCSALTCWWLLQEKTAVRVSTIHPLGIVKVYTKF